MKRTARWMWPVCLVFLVGLAGAVSRASASIVKGPYLQNVSRDGIVVMWETSEPSEGWVHYGRTPACRETVADENTAAIHEVALRGLRPDTRYFYRISSGGEVSRAYSFRTAPEGFRGFRFAVYGDTRSQPQEHAKVAAAVLRASPRFVLHTGDLVAVGTDYAQWGEQFFTPAAPLMARIPVFPCLGNHERNASWYYDFFSLPAGGGEREEEWYSFDFGNAHFTVLDTETKFGPGSAQYAWLEQDLASARQEWKFVMFHRPVCSSGAHGGQENPALGQYLAPLFEKYDVDVVFNGHDHIYERSYRNGVYYIVAGGGGAPLYEVDQTPNPYQQRAAKRYHFCTVEISWKVAILQARDAEGRVFDTVTIRHR